MARKLTLRSGLPCPQSPTGQRYLRSKQNGRPGVAKFALTELGIKLDSRYPLDELEQELQSKLDPRNYEAPEPFYDGEDLDDDEWFEFREALDEAVRAL